MPHIIADGDSEQIERWVRPPLRGEIVGAEGNGFRRITRNFQSERLMLATQADAAAA